MYQGVERNVQSGTQSGAIWGIRDLPDKCICDTNAYLAKNSRNYLHPIGCHYNRAQERKAEHQPGKEWVILQGGAAYV